MSALPTEPLSGAEAAGRALVLAQLISKATEELEELKVKLRSEARELLLHSGATVSLRGCDKDGKDLGEVTVTFPKPTPALAKNFSPLKVEAALGRETFDLYFETKVVLRKGVMDTLQERKEEGSATRMEVDTLFSAVDMTEPTPRVGFRPLTLDLSASRVR